MVNLKKICNELTYANLLVFSSGGQVSAIRTETDTPDIKIPILINRIILQGGDKQTGSDVEDLRRAVAASGNVFTIGAKSHAADDAIVLEMVDKLDIQHARNFGIENGKPVLTLFLMGRRDLVEVEFTQVIEVSKANVFGGGSGAWNLWGRSGVWIYDLMRLLRGCWSSRSSTAGLARTRGRGRGRARIGSYIYINLRLYSQK